MTKEANDKIMIGNSEFTIKVRRSISVIKGDPWELRPDETLHIEDVKIIFSVKGHKFVGTDVKKLNANFKPDADRITKGAFGYIVGTPMALKKESFDILKNALEKVKEEAMFPEWGQYIAEEETAERNIKIKCAKETIAEAEKELSGTGELMTREEIKEWNRNYNNIVNEGGSGYVPSHISIEAYEDAKNILKELNS